MVDAVKLPDTMKRAMARQAEAERESLAREQAAADLRLPAASITPVPAPAPNGAAPAA